MANPINAFDPDGLKIQFANPGSPAANLLQQAYKKVRKTKRGGELCRALEQSPKIYTIDDTLNGPLVGDPSRPASYTDFGSNTTYVDPSRHPLVETTEGATPASTADLLGHELGHLATGTLDDGPGNMNNVNQNENPIRQGLGDPPRITYP